VVAGGETILARLALVVLVAGAMGREQML